jgi:LmbE family N-acetylglucosaminyl deacetylase
LWLGASERPNTWVDIGESMEAKREALAAHPSQLGPEVIEFAAGMARFSAAGQEFEFGESFRRIVLDQPFIQPDVDG